MKSLFAVLAFVIVFIAVSNGLDYLFSVLPWWVGLVLVLGFIGFLIAILVKIGRSY